MGFKDRIKKMQGDLKDRTKESYDTKDDRGYTSGSIFIKEKMPEEMKFWNPKPGPHSFDVLPWEVGENHHKLKKGTLAYVLDIWVYQNVGPLNDQFCCPSKMWRDPDPIQEFMVANRLPKEEWQQKKAKRRCIYLVWVHDSTEEEEEGPMLYEVSHFFMEEKLQEAAEMPEGGGQIVFADWTKNGKTIYFNIKEDGKWQDASGNEHPSFKYVGHKFIDRKDDIPDDILEKLDGLHLDELVKMRPTYEEIEESFKGGKKDETKPTETTAPEGGEPDLEERREKTEERREEEYDKSGKPGGDDTPEPEPEPEPEEEEKPQGTVTTTRRKLKIRKRTS